MISAEPLNNFPKAKSIEIFSFMLRTNLATRRTFVRLRADKITASALILLSLSVLHHFFLSHLKKKRAVKTFVFHCSLFSFKEDFFSALRLILRSDMRAAHQKLSCIRSCPLRSFLLLHVQSRQARLP